MRTVLAMCLLFAAGQAAPFLEKRNKTDGIPTELRPFVTGYEGQTSAEKAARGTGEGVFKIHSSLGGRRRLSHESEPDSDEESPEEVRSFQSSADSVGSRTVVDANSAEEDRDFGGRSDEDAVTRLLHSVSNIRGTRRLDQSEELASDGGLKAVGEAKSAAFRSGDLVAMSEKLHEVHGDESSGAFIDGVSGTDRRSGSLPASGEATLEATVASRGLAQDDASSLSYSEQKVMGTPSTGVQSGSSSEEELASAVADYAIRVGSFGSPDSATDIGTGSVSHADAKGMKSHVLVGTVAVSAPGSAMHSVGGQGNTSSASSEHATDDDADVKGDVGGSNEGMAAPGVTDSVPGPFVPSSHSAQNGGDSVGQGQGGVVSNAPTLQPAEGNGGAHGVRGDNGADSSLFSGIVTGTIASSGVGKEDAKEVASGQGSAVGLPSEPAHVDEEGNVAGAGPSEAMENAPGAVENATQSGRVPHDDKSGGVSDESQNSKPTPMSSQGGSAGLGNDASSIHLEDHKQPSNSGASQPSSFSFTYGSNVAARGTGASDGIVPSSGYQGGNADSDASHEVFVARIDHSTSQTSRGGLGLAEENTAVEEPVAAPIGVGAVDERSPGVAADGMVPGGVSETDTDGQLAVSEAGPSDTFAQHRLGALPGASAFGYGAVSAPTSAGAGPELSAASLSSASGGNAPEAIPAGTTAARGQHQSAQVASSDTLTAKHRYGNNSAGFGGTSSGTDAAEASAPGLSSGESHSFQRTSASSGRENADVPTESLREFASDFKKFEQSLPELQPEFGRRLSASRPAGTPVSADDRGVFKIGAPSRQMTMQSGQFTATAETNGRPDMPLGTSDGPAAMESEGSRTKDVVEEIVTKEEAHVLCPVGVYKPGCSERARNTEVSSSHAGRSRSDTLEGATDKTEGPKHSLETSEIAASHLATSPSIQHSDKGSELPEGGSDLHEGSTEDHGPLDGDTYDRGSTGSDEDKKSGAYLTSSEVAKVSSFESVRSSNGDMFIKRGGHVGGIQGAQQGPNAATAAVSDHTPSSGELSEKASADVAGNGMSTIGDAASAEGTKEMQPSDGVRVASHNEGTQQKDVGASPSSVSDTAGKEGEHMREKGSDADVSAPGVSADTRPVTVQELGESDGTTGMSIGAAQIMDGNRTETDVPHESTAAADGPMQMGAENDEPIDHDSTDEEEEYPAVQVEENMFGAERSGSRSDAYIPAQARGSQGHDAMVKVGPPLEGTDSLDHQSDTTMNPEMTGSEVPEHPDITPVTVHPHGYNRSVAATTPAVPQGSQLMDVPGSQDNYSVPDHSPKPMVSHDVGFSGPVDGHAQQATRHEVHGSGASMMPEMTGDEMPGHPHVTAATVHPLRYNHSEHPALPQGGQLTGVPASQSSYPVPDQPHQPVVLQNVGRRDPADDVSVDGQNRFPAAQEADMAKEQRPSYVQHVTQHDAQAQPQHMNTQERHPSSGKVPGDQQFQKQLPCPYPELHVSGQHQQHPSLTAHRPFDVKQQGRPGVPEASVTPHHDDHHEPDLSSQQPTAVGPSPYAPATVTVHHANGAVSFHQVDTVDAHRVPAVSGIPAHHTGASVFTSVGHYEPGRVHIHQPDVVGAPHGDDHFPAGQALHSLGTTGQQSVPDRGTQDTHGVEQTKGQPASVEHHAFDTQQPHTESGDTLFSIDDAVAKYYKDRVVVAFDVPRHILPSNVYHRDLHLPAGHHKVTLQQGSFSPGPGLEHSSPTHTPTLTPHETSGLQEPSGVTVLSQSFGPPATPDAAQVHVPSKELPGSADFETVHIPYPPFYITFKRDHTSPKQQPDPALQDGASTGLEGIGEVKPPGQHRALDVGNTFVLSPDTVEHPFSHHARPGLPNGPLAFQLPPTEVRFSSPVIASPGLFSYTSNVPGFVHPFENSVSTIVSQPVGLPPLSYSPHAAVPQGPVHRPFVPTLRQQHLTFYNVGQPAKAAPQSKFTLPRPSKLMKSLRTAVASKVPSGGLQRFTLLRAQGQPSNAGQKPTFLASLVQPLRQQRQFFKPQPQPTPGLNLGGTQQESQPVYGFIR